MSIYPVKLILVAGLFAGYGVAQAQPGKPTCVPDKAHDRTLSAVRPAADQACRDSLAQWEQSECTQATFDRDWTAYVKRRSTRLQQYQIELTKMQGGNPTANLQAIKTYIEEGSRRMERTVVDQPGTCIQKRRPVPAEASDFTRINGHMKLWAGTQGQLLLTGNTAAYGALSNCRLAGLTHAYRLAEAGLGLIKEAPPEAPRCSA